MELELPHPMSKHQKMMSPDKKLGDLKIVREKSYLHWEEEFFWNDV